MRWLYLRLMMFRLYISGFHLELLESCLLLTAESRREYVDRVDLIYRNASKLAIRTVYRRDICLARGLV